MLKGGGARSFGVVLTWVLEVLAMLTGGGTSFHSFREKKVGGGGGGGA